MKYLPAGQFFGETNAIIHMDGITLTDTEYTHSTVDWHYHEHPYFTFILQGNVIEGNKKEVYHCTAGSLLFHNWQDAHYNIKPEGFTRGFHIELQTEWISHFEITLNNLQGSIHLQDPHFKLLLYKIVKETKMNDDVSALSIQTLLLELLSSMQQREQALPKHLPAWTKTIQEFLRDTVNENVSLKELSTLLNIHPVHLSRQFPKYFHCSLGEYARQLKIEKSISLLANRKQTLASIAYECGFADQSHFCRCFRQLTGTSPLNYRKLIFA